jgi:cobalt-precorrin-5B (C1)-methyltransferase
MAFDLYVNNGNKRLRCGYTTGSCATLASKAGARMLMENTVVSMEEIITPKGIPVRVDIIGAILNKSAKCAVKKDAGDDYDITDGILIYSTVTLKDDVGVTIIGGEGVGVVTQRGLDQPVGAAAINSTPRRMITDELRKIAEEYKYKGGFHVVIEVPQGLEAAKKTFNKKLGIEGGISIIGTTGIVEPQSLQALIDTIEVEMKVLSSNGRKSIIATPGNYGKDFIEKYPKLSSKPVISYSNFVGEMLDFGSSMAFDEILIVTHLGKGIKLAGGIMNTHSRYADARAEIFAAYTALEGGSRELIKEIMDAKTTDACVELLLNEGLLQGTIDGIINSAQSHLEYRVAGKYSIGVIVYSNIYGLLGMSESAKNIIDGWEKNE